MKTSKEFSTSCNQFRSEEKSSYSDYVNRIVFRIVNESLRCLEEGVLETPQSVDVGAIYGLGFPRDLLGPCLLVDDLHPRVVLKILERHYEDTKRDGFLPNGILQAQSDV
ncbi:hypothetical protein MXB_3855 [Myxobolus squamalis]|nr:hypothetical protein MXB_3855 [Myxobolus squamalis]